MVFCCKKCRKRYHYAIWYSKNRHKLIKTKKCKICGKSFNPYGTQAYCSKECAEKSRRHKMPKYHNTYYTKNKDKVIASVNRWGKANIEKRRQIHNKCDKKRRSNPIVRLNMCISAGLNKSMKGLKAGRHWEELTGYTVPQLKAHLEKQFDKHMTWNNYGTYWHVDHKIPVANFDCSDMEQLKACWSLSNLQPLEAHENMSKGAKVA